MSRFALALALLAGVGCNKTDVQRAPQHVSPPDLAPRQSRGWQPTRDGFVPDNSDVVAQRKAIDAARAARDGGADEEREERQNIPLTIVFGKERKTVAAADLAKVKGAGDEKRRSLADVIAWAYPKKKIKTVFFGGESELRVEVPMSVVEKNRDGYSLRVNRRGAVRLELPSDDKNQIEHKPEHGQKGQGVTRQRKSHIDQLELK